MWGWWLGWGWGYPLCCNEQSGLTYLYSVAWCKGGGRERERSVKSKLLIRMRIGEQRVCAERRQWGEFWSKFG